MDHKALAGQWIEPAAHAVKQEPGNLYFLLSHLFIMHEGHLPSRKMKGNFFYYTPERGGSGLDRGSPVEQKIFPAGSQE
jgi:hypothetical protein